MKIDIKNSSNIKKTKTKAVQVIVIALILIAVLAKRFYLKNFSYESLLSFLAGIAIVLVGFLIMKILLRNKLKN